MVGPVSPTRSISSGHLTNPEHPATLQSGVGEVDRAVSQRLVEIAAPDQHQRDNVAREFEQQPLGLGYTARGRARNTETTCCCPTAAGTPATSRCP